MIMPRAPTKASAQNGVGFVERDAHGEVVDLLDLHVLVAADGDRGGRRILGVFPVEHDVVGGERLAVVPLHAALELPGDRLAVRRQARRSRGSGISAASTGNRSPSGSQPASGS